MSRLSPKSFVPTPFFVQQKLPVLITVTVSANCLGIDAAMYLDFSSGTQAITLSGVLFGFTPL